MVFPLITTFIDDVPIKSPFIEGCFTKKVAPKLSVLFFHALAGQRRAGTRQILAFMGGMGS